MSKKAARIAAGVIAGFLVLGMLFGLLADLFWSSASNQTKLTELKKQLSTATSEKNDLKSTLSGLKADQATLMEKKSGVEQQINLTEEQIDLTNGILEELSSQIDQKTQEIATATQQEDEQYELFKTRVRAMYENDVATELELVLTSGSLTEAMSRIELTSDIAEYDRTLMKRLGETRQYIEELKAGLEDDQTQQETYKNDLISHQSDLSAQNTELDGLIETLSSQVEENEKAFSEAEQEEAAFKNQINSVMASIQKEKEEAARKAAAAKKASSSSSSSSSTKYNGGAMGWPLPGYYTITSDYGMRMHPTLHVYKMHTGIDIAAPKGTKAYAAASGTVVSAGYNAAYGNYVLVDCGGNVATLYGHFSKIQVQVNQTVTKGKTVIGLVGATGYATGNHLHFEVRIGGNDVSPWKYLSK